MGLPSLDRTWKQKLAPFFGSGYDYPLRLRLVEVASIIVALMLTVLNMYKAFVIMGKISSAIWLVVPFSVFLGICFADFGTGFIHWAADNLGSVDTPLLGPAFIYPFRLHHVDPQEITRHDFLEVNGLSFTATIPFIIVFGSFVFDEEPYVWKVFMEWLTMTAVVFAWFTNEFHKLSHMHNPPWWAKCLQRCGLILSPEMHHIHHVTLDSFYSICTGWTNYPLEYFRFYQLITKRYSISTPPPVKPLRRS